MLRKFFAGGLVALALAAASPALAAYSNAKCIVLGGTSSPFTLSTFLPTWNNADNRITVLSAGGDGAVGASGSAGGGGGGNGVSFVVNATLSATNAFQVGTHGGTSNTTAASWVCNGTVNCSTINAAGVIASIRGGSTATSSGGAGATTTNSVGTATGGAAGGAGGGSRGGGGGGGATGLSGAGAAGVAGAAGTPFFGAGGQGDNATGGAGANTVSGNGTDGGETVNCTGDVTGPIGAGGGGAGGNISGSLNGGNGGKYGAGGGGAFFGGTAGSGGNGILIFEWNPVASGSNTGPGSLLGIVGMAANDNVQLAANENDAGAPLSTAGADQ